MHIVTIIVHRNTPELVDRQVKQIQTMTNICKRKSFPKLKNDILVVDCGSDEDKRTSYPSYWYPDPNFRGKCYGHNVGLNQLKPKRYRYYWFNHPDLDFDVDMNCLEKLLLVMTKNSEIGLLSPKHSTPYLGRDQKGLQLGWHKVSTCDYLSLLIRGECVEKIGFLNPDFKYCWGAIHEYSHLLYKNGWCVAYCDDAHVTHLGGSTYGKKHAKTISREEYKRRAKMFARKYFVGKYGENWDEIFSKYLPTEVKGNTYKLHRKFWEQQKEAKIITFLKKVRRKVLPYKVRREVRLYITQRKSHEFFHVGNNKGGVRLHLGCGNRKRMGWVNIDVDEKVKPDIVANAKDLNMFEDSSVDEIECCHLFEHFTYRGAVTALKEWYRILKKGGKLSLELPNFEKCIEILYKKHEEEAQKLAMIGIYGYTPDIQKYGLSLVHKYGWTPETLTNELMKVGFSEIKQVSVTQTWRKATKYDRDMRWECMK